MNYLDISPNDVMKIINRKVQDAQIIKRRTERKENKRIQREKKQIADNKILEAEYDTLTYDRLKKRIINSITII